VAFSAKHDFSYARPRTTEGNAVRREVLEASPGEDTRATHDSRTENQTEKATLS
jgi:hypothetical protein